MARDKKRYMCSRLHYRRICMQLVQKMEMATDAERYDELWEKFTNAIDRWTLLEQKNGRWGNLCGRWDAVFYDYYHFKPVFDETYLELTQRLSEIRQCKGEAKSQNDLQKAAALERRYKDLRVRRRRTAAYTKCV